MKVKLILEYDGSQFHGWQRQEGLFTVQGELERSLHVYLAAEYRKSGLEPPKEFPLIQGSGRTDAGVHALSQCGSFSWPQELDFDARRLKAALEGISHRAYMVTRLEPVQDDFNARFSPHEKCYRYYLRLVPVRGGYFDKRVWCVGSKLDIAKMIEASRHFVGEHDFAAFRAADCSASTTVRTITLSQLTTLDHSLLVYEVCGRGFLKQMVRIMVGTLVEIGRGHMPASIVARLLAGGERRNAGPTAPPHGLVLQWIKYDRPNLV